MSTPGTPRPSANPLRRRIPEQTIVAVLALDGWGADWIGGRADEALACGRDALAKAIEAGAGYAVTPCGGRLFDSIEVDDFLQWREDLGEAPFWSDRTRRTREALVASTRAGDRPGPGPSARPPTPTRFTVLLERTFDLRRFARGRPVRLRVPTPLSGDYHDAITVTHSIPPELGAAISTSEGRLDIRLDVPVDPVVSVAARFDFVGHAPAPDGGDVRLSDREREIWLRPEEGLIGVTPSVSALAWRLAGSKDPAAAVATFASYLSDRFRFRQVRYDELVGSPCDWALDTRTYDCLLCSALMAALCRARGIPARMVTGHYLSRLCSARHAWVEIGIDGLGWAPLDILHHERRANDYPEHEDWWFHFKRRWDYRMVFERLPLTFTGPMSIRFPKLWTMVTLPDPRGTVIRHIDLADGSLIYQDRISVDWRD
jgi:hypothetical protein